jgi:hypothetical protein
MGTPARFMTSKSVKSDGTDKSQNLKNSRRANATIIKLMVDSCTHKFSFFTFVGRVKSDQYTIKATIPPIRLGTNRMRGFRIPDSQYQPAARAKGSHAG